LLGERKEEKERQEATKNTAAPKRHRYLGNVDIVSCRFIHYGLVCFFWTASILLLQLVYNCRHSSGGYFASALHPRQDLIGWILSSMLATN